MPLTVKFIGAFRHISGKNNITVHFQEDISISKLVNQLSQQIPELKNTLCGQGLNVSRSNSLILVNGKEISVLNGYETRKEISVLNGYETQLNDEDEIVFIPVVHGG